MSLGDQSSADQAQQAFDPARIYVWIRSIESKVNTLLREVDLLKNDFLKRQQDIRKEQKVFTEDLTELRHQQDAINQKIDLIVRELKQTAGREEIAVLKRYVELWNPMNFVTQRDLERAVEAATGKKPYPERAEETRHINKEISPFQ